MSHPELMADALAACAARGLLIDDIVPDGRVRRVPTVDRRHSRNGAYQLDPTGRGWVENHADGLGPQYVRPTVISISPEARQRAERMSRARRIEAERLAERAMLRAADMNRRAGPVNRTHGYVRAKGVVPYGARQLGDLIVLALVDGTRITTAQTIAQDGTKRFLRGGRKQGSYVALGVICDTAIVVCEGWATGCSIHQATGLPVACAMDAGNLMAVALSFRRRYPGVRIILAADNDCETTGNPGLTNASTAARSVGGIVAAPVGMTRASDFNDVHAALGIEAVRAEIMGVLA